MATTIRQTICDEIHVKEDEIEELKAVLGAISQGALDVKMDDIRPWSPRWFRITDKSGSLSARLLGMGFGVWNEGRKRATSSGMQTNLFVPVSDKFGSVHFDVIQPGEDCRTLRVQITREQTITVCGELPSNYEVIEVLGET